MINFLFRINNKFLSYYFGIHVHHKNLIDYEKKYMSNTFYKR